MELTPTMKKSWVTQVESCKSVEEFNWVENFNKTKSYVLILADERARHLREKSQGKEITPKQERAKNIGKAH